MKRHGWMALLPLVIAAQDRPELARFAAERQAALFAEQYPAIESPELTAAIDRVQGQLRDAPRLRVSVVRYMDSAASEAIPMADRLFVPVELARRVKDDDELAGMVAHALAHAGQAPLAAPAGSATIPAYFLWPSPEGLVPMGMRALVAQREQETDAAAVEMLTRSSINPSGLLRYLERASAGPERLNALRSNIASAAALVYALPLTSECEVVQALLDEIYGKPPKPALRR